MSFARLRTYLSPIAVGLVLFAGVSASFELGRLDIERRAANERSRVTAELGTVRARLHGIIQSTFSSTDGLIHLVQLSGGIDQSLFDGMARLAIGKNPHIRNITLAPNDRIAMVYPLGGNEKALGFRYVTNPEQYRTVQRARAERHAILAGPVELVQGGRGLINRSPLFIDRRDGPHYWGTVSVVAFVDSIFEDSGITANPDIAIAIRGKDGQGAEGDLVVGDAALFQQAPVTMAMPIPGGEWQLAARPVAGWSSGSVFDSTYFYLGMLNTLVVAGVFGMVALQSRRMRLKNLVLEREVQERMRAESALREEEERFRTLFDSSPDPAWILEGGTFSACNEAAVRMLGHASADDVLFLRPVDLSPELQPDGEPSATKAERMIALAQKNGIHRFEWIHRRADGSDFPAEVTLSTITLQGKQALYCAWRDISERKAAEATLRAHRELLQAIVDSAGAVIYVFDSDGRLLLCNHQFEVAVGCRREDVIGKRRSEFMPRDVAAEHEANDQLVMASRARTSFEERNIEAGGVRYYLTVKCPVIERGELRAVVGISTDITERRQSEDQLRLASTIITTTAEGVLITNEKAQIISVNRAFTEITGYTEAEVLGHSPNVLRSERQDPDFYQRMWASLAQGDVWQGEIWNRRKSGEIFPEWLTITAIRDKQGSVCNYVGVFSDISSLKRSQEQLERLAHFDPLTDLPNRFLFQDRLSHAIERAQRQPHQLAILLMDLDGFKTVNDSLGHPVGDRLLQEVAERLKASVRVDDTVARLGGDEFALILPELSDGSDAVEVIRKILTNIQEPFNLDGVSAMVTGSIGVSSTQPMAAMPSSSSATPTPPCTAPRRRAATPTASTKAP